LQHLIFISFVVSPSRYSDVSQLLYTHVKQKHPNVSFVYALQTTKYFGLLNTPP